MQKNSSHDLVRLGMGSKFSIWWRSSMSPFHAGVWTLGRNDETCDFFDVLFYAFTHNYRIFTLLVKPLLFAFYRHFTNFIKNYQKKK
jgi:hypothetical protein